MGCRTRTGQSGRPRIAVLFTATLALGWTPHAARAAAQAADDGPAFRAQLADAERLLGAGKWKDARDALKALLDAHREHDEVLLHATELREDLRRAEFGMHYAPRGVEQLISGELKSYDARSGKIKLRYQRAKPTPKDDEEYEGEESSETRMFRELLGLDNQVGGSDFTWAGGAPMHPINFSGPYTVEITGEFPEWDDDNRIFFFSPEVVLSVGDSEWYVINFGFPQTVIDTTTWHRSAFISHSIGGRRETLDEQNYSPIKRGKTYKLKVVVTADKITASCNGKTFLSAKREGENYGQFGFRWCPDVQELNISGQANTAWLEGLVDADRHRAWKEFGEANGENAFLPEWLAGRLEGELPTYEQTIGRFPGEFSPYHVTHLVKLKHFAKDGEYAEAVKYIQELAANKCTEPFRDYQLAFLCERTDDAEQALEHCDKALAAAPDLVPLRVLRARLLRRLHRGPEAVSDLRVLADAGHLDGSLHAELASQTLMDAGPAPARAVVHAALGAGVPAGELAQIDAILVRAQRGPAWSTVHEFKSRSYEVRSDHSQKLCADAAQALEQSLSLYNRVLGRPEATDGGQKLYSVYLFSGLSGYLGYAEALFGSTPYNTAGLYSPVLKQLLIWNLPERDAMLRTVRHEGFHQYLDRMLPITPVWMNEGTAEYFETAALSGGRVEHGAPVASHVLRLTGKQVEWATIDELIHMGRAEFYGDSARNYAQSWALVHYLLQGDRTERQIYTDYFEALLAGTSPRDAGEQVFGKVDTTALLGKLKRHIKTLREALDGGP
jgi:tetratricopeptide (TPR) repeat protein